jgi:DNA-binding LacI/PurR family transcriptional regulator
MPKRVSISQQEIADQLKLSRTTVSRCFTNHPGINPDTRAQVFALASRLGYQYMEPRTTNRKPRKKNSNFTMAVLVCSEVEEYNRPDYQSPGAEILPGISEYALLKKLQMDVQFTSPGEGTLQDPSWRLLMQRSKNWDGVLLVYPFPSSVIEELQGKFVCVSLVEQYGFSSLNCVDVDHYKGLSQVIDLLVERGHRRIGFFSRHYEVEAAWAFRRFSAYVEKMTRLGLSIRREDIINVWPESKVGRQDTEELLKDSHERAYQMTMEGVTAWVCGADHQAYDLISYLQRKGLRVPLDASVTGFDGIAKPSWAPMLTTVQIPYREIGYMGAKRLYELTHRRFDVAQHILLECKLIAGETVGSVNSLVKKNR